MDTEELKEQCREKFEEYIDLYYEGFRRTFTKEYLRKQLNFFPDPIGKFIFPCFANIHNYAEQEFADVEEFEDWQKEKFKDYIDQQMRIMNEKVTDYMMHILTLKMYLNFWEISDE